MIIRNVTVINGLGDPPITNAEVVIEGDRFREIRPNETSGDSTSVFDGRSGYLIPGLWESHTHVAGVAMGEPGLPGQVARVEKLLADYLESGITTAIDLGGSLEHGHAVREHQRVASPATAELFFAGPLFTGVEGWRSTCTTTTRWPTRSPTPS